MIIKRRFDLLRALEWKPQVTIENDLKCWAPITRILLTGMGLIKQYLECTGYLWGQTIAIAICQDRVCLNSESYRFVWFWSKNNRAGIGIVIQGLKTGNKMFRSNRLYVMLLSFKCTSIVCKY
jgi:hypothetical protein